VFTFDQVPYCCTVHIFRQHKHTIEFTVTFADVASLYDSSLIDE